MDPEKEDPFKKHIKGFVVLFGLMSAFGFVLIILGAHSMDVSADVENALGGWRLRVTSSLVMFVGFVSFVSGFVCSVAAYKENNRIMYIVGIILIPLVLGLVAIGISSLLGFKKVKRESLDKTTEAFKKINASEETRKALFNLQIEKKCCGVHGPSFYSFFVSPDGNATYHFVPDSCCGGFGLNPVSAPDSLGGENRTMSNKTSPSTTTPFATPEPDGKFSWSTHRIDYCRSDLAYQDGCARKVKASMKKAYLYMGGLTLLCACFLLIIIAVEWYLIGHYRKMLIDFLKI